MITAFAANNSFTSACTFPSVEEIVAKSAAVATSAKEDVNASTADFIVVISPCKPETEAAVAKPLTVAVNAVI